MDMYLIVNGITLLDFLWLSTLFVTTLLTYFQSGKKFSWGHNLLLGVQVGNWLLYMLFPKPMETRILATLLIISIIMVEGITQRKSRLASENHN